jgi:N-formylglutamate deformylase
VSTEPVSSTIIHVPHASTVIPADVRSEFVLNDADLQHEIRVMTDHLTDRLFDVPGVVAVRFPVCRLVVDPERFESDDEEVMAARGMGVVYTRTSAGVPLRRSLTAAQRGELIATFYRPHHAALEAAVDRALAQHQRCVLIDAHSFPASPLPYEVYQDADRADICIGTDDFHTPDELLGLVVEACRRAGWTVTVNRPFSGALVPTTFYKSNPAVHAVMIEVNRRLYLDERTATASPGFEECQRRLATVLAAIRAAYE